MVLDGIARPQDMTGRVAVQMCCLECGASYQATGTYQGLAQATCRFCGAFLIEFSDSGATGASEDDLVAFDPELELSRAPFAAEEGHA